MECVRLICPIPSPRIFEMFVEELGKIATGIFGGK